MNVPSHTTVPVIRFLDVMGYNRENVRMQGYPYTWECIFTSMPYTVTTCYA